MISKEGSNPYINYFDKIRKELKNMAMNKTVPMGYKEFCVKVLNLKFEYRQFTTIVNKVCELDYKREKPLLCTLLINNKKKLPGSGYFNHFKTYKFKEMTKEEFFNEQKDRVYAHDWLNEP